MRSEFLALCDEVGLPENMKEYDKETGQFKYRTASVMWLGFSKAWEKRQTEVDEYKSVAENLDEMYVIEKQKSNDLQKRVDAAVIEIEKLHLSGVIGFGTVKKLEQALKGGDQ